MEHLNLETLARLVDEAPTDAEREHLAGCEECTAKRDELVQQTAALGGLPELVPPQGDWRELEARLRSEGLIESPGLFQTLGLARTPEWMRMAAALVLFLAGATAGAVVQSNVPVAHASTLDEAAEQVRIAEDEYVRTVAVYREFLAAEGGESIGSNPEARLAALGVLGSVAEAAVRQAPGDPFINGLLTSVLAEQEATARLVRTSGGNWF